MIRALLQASTINNQSCTANGAAPVWGRLFNCRIDSGNHSKLQERWPDSAPVRVHVLDVGVGDESTKHR